MTNAEDAGDAEEFEFISLRPLRFNSHPVSQKSGCIFPPDKMLFPFDFLTTEAAL